jgi:thiamine-phosphate pyrophosphorylase
MVMGHSLARQQRRLNAALPLVLFTDDREADWEAAARALARACPGAGLVVVRARDAAKRAALAERLAGIAPLLIAGDADLAARSGAAGLHLPEARMGEAMDWRARHPRWIVTAAAHSLRAVLRARQVDAVFLSPVFATASHPGAKALSPARAASIAAAARVPVYALGGVTAGNAGRLAPSFSGIAAIGSLLAPC